MGRRGLLPDGLIGRKARAELHPGLRPPERLVPSPDEPREARRAGRLTAEGNGRPDRAYRRDRLTWATFAGLLAFGFLNAVLRTPWMPPADPFFAQGYVNYYYYGQFVMGVLMKLVGIYPALGINLAIPMLYALTFTAGASIVYNIVARSQWRRGSEHRVSRSGMVFGFLSGFLMLAIGNMHGAYELFMIWFPQQGAELDFEHI